MTKSIGATKHFQLARTLRDELRTMRAGEPVHTVQQLKDRFNVSQATVTRALDRLKGEGLIHRPAGRSRFVVNELGPRALCRVAIIRPTWPSPDYDAIVRGLIELGEGRGWAFETFAVQGSLEDLDLNRAIGTNDAAVLLSINDRMPEHLLRALRKPRKPVVVVRDIPREMPGDAVSVDDELVGFLATDHLLSRGHRRILAVVSEPTSRSNTERVTGWRRAMAEAGHAKAAERLLFQSPVSPSQDSIEVTFKSFSRFLKQAPPAFTGVFCADWTGALAVSRAIREVLGKTIPDDISLVSFAGESMLLPYLNPPMSAVEIEIERFAKAALDLVERRLDDPSAEAQHLRITPFFVERQSVK